LPGAPQKQAALEHSVFFSAVRHSSKIKKGTKPKPSPLSIPFPFPFHFLFYDELLERRS
jgi:hypothetical protein